MKKNFLEIELAHISRTVVIIVDGIWPNEMDALASSLRSLDPDRLELKRVSVGAKSGCDVIIQPTESSARAILNFVRAYVGTEKSRTAVRRYLHRAAA
jgi:hypothetical protein